MHKNHFIIAFVIFLTLLNLKSYGQLVLPKKIVSKHFIYYKENMISEPKTILLTNDNSKTTFFQIDSTGSKFNNTLKFPVSKPDLVCVAANGKIWVIENNQLSSYSIKVSKKINSIPLPNNVTFTDLQKGFDDTFFGLDALNNKIYRYSNNKWDVVYEGKEIENANCMTLQIDSLLIGTRDGLKVIEIQNFRLETIASNLNNVKKIAVDYWGNLVVLTNDSLVRIKLNGETKYFCKAENIVDFALNPNKNQLFTVNSNNEIKVLDYLKLIDESQEHWALTQKRNMKPFSTNDLVLVGSEFYIVTKNEKDERVEKELEGYYPELGIFHEGFPANYTPSARAIACAEKSYLAFKKWTMNLPVNFKNTFSKTPPMFWLMVNDFSDRKGEKEEKLLRPNASLWYWKRNPSVNGRVPGYWKWEATLNQDCKCEIPNKKQAQEFIEEYLKTNK